MDKGLISIKHTFKIEFYDVDSMQVVWHGNYIKYIESGRCVLLEKIGYGYKEMIKDGFAFPITNLSVKYIRSLYFGEEAQICCTLLEYENRIKIKYEIFNSKGELCTKAETVQMALNLQTNESHFICPPRLIKSVEQFLKNASE